MLAYMMIIFSTLLVVVIEFLVIVYEPFNAGVLLKTFIYFLTILNLLFLSQLHDCLSSTTVFRNIQ